MGLPRIVDQARAVIGALSLEGTRVVDATVGNGHDTLFLAERVGPGGLVLGFDIQPQALAIAESRLREARLEGRVRLIQAGHERLPEWVGPNESIRAAMFNLGYLPNGDHRVVTLATTTRAAVSCALTRLEPGGLITLVIYSGHPGGEEEADAVLSLARSLDPAEYEVAWTQLLNRREPAPSLLVLSRR